MSTGLYDDRGNLIAQTYLGATGHVGVMPVIGKNLVQRFPRETIRPGDVFISNDPWVCNGQTADVFITMPAFHRDRLIGFSINSVHHVDIGGRKGSGLAEEVYEEGLIIPLMRLHEAGRPNEVLLSLIERNVRFSDKVMGDLRAQMAAGWVGAEGLAPHRRRPPSRGSAGSRRRRDRPDRALDPRRHRRAPRRHVHQVPAVRDRRQRRAGQDPAHPDASRATGSPPTSPAPARRCAARSTRRSTTPAPMSRCRSR